MTTESQPRLSKPGLPKPSFAPALLALGLVCLLWGVVTTWLLSAAGLIVIAYASFRWIEDVRPDPAAAVPEFSDRRQPAPRAAAKAGPAPRLESLMSNPWLHRYSILLAVFTLALMITGAIITSHGAAASRSLRETHYGLAAAVGLLAIGLALWLWKSGTGVWERRLGWIVLAATAVQALLGIQNPVLAVFHAWWAQLFFALTVSVALVTSQSWTPREQPLADSGRLSLRTLSLIAVGLMVLQVGLGAAVRHKAMGAVPHIINALVVTIVLILLAVLVTHQFPENPTLNPAAKTLIGLVFTQVMLGMGAFITRLMADEASLAVTIPSVTHVAVGALTFATTVVLALLIYRHVERVAPSTELPDAAEPELHDSGR
jgi:heme A synthase